MKRSDTRVMKHVLLLVLMLTSNLLSVDAGKQEAPKGK
jgi:hypothetical protein